MPEILQHSRTVWSRPVCTLVLLVCLVVNHAGADEATSPNFRLIGQTSLMAAGTAQSTGFRLQSCIDASPSGVSASSSFKLGSGCLPLVLVAADTDQPNPASNSPRAVPLFDIWQIVMLMFMLGLLAWGSLRGRRTD